MRKIRLYVSGGSHRAALAGVGTILYLVDGKGQFRWADVDEVVSVSGGTQPVAALAAADAVSDHETIAALRSYFETAVGDGVTWRTPRRFLITLAAVTVVALPIAAYIVLSALFVPALISFPIGVIAIGFVYFCITRLGAMFLRDYLRTVIGAAGPNADKPLGHSTATKHAAVGGAADRLYVMSSVGLDSATPYFAWTNRSGNVPDAEGAGEVQGLTPVEASTASSSLPTLARIVAPKQNSQGHPLPRRDELIDGGIGGNFGLQITRRAAQEIASGAATPVNRVILAVDAGRRIDPSPGPMRVMRTFSTVARLARWIQIGSDATYMNDVQDIEDVNPAVRGLLRVSRTSDAITGDAGFMEVQKQQEAAIGTNADLTLFSPDPQQMRLAVACGVVGTYLADSVSAAALLGTNALPTGSYAEAQAALDLAGGHLGVGSAIRTAWEQAPGVKK